MKPEAAYKELVEKTKEVSLLDSCGSVLVWDQQTYMPPVGAAHRATETGYTTGSTPREPSGT